jgi:hypothetical protein
VSRSGQPEVGDPLLALQQLLSLSENFVKGHGPTSPTADARRNALRTGSTDLTID